MSDAVALKKIEAVVLRVPAAVPVRTSFGVMRDRPAVLLRLTDGDGVRGYGEVWCNFPSVGAEHRKRLVDEVIGPILLGLGPQKPDGLFDRLMGRLHILALQSGEWGPLAQVAAGFDAALHDLAARRAGLPLHRHLAPESSHTIRAYASGIGPEDPARVAEAVRVQGHVAFKLKVGFGRETDLGALEAIRTAIGRDATLMIDANQGWGLPEALERCTEYAQFGLTWVEEPLPADRPLDEWRELARADVPLAAGENMVSLPAYEATVESGALGFVQPDVAKWGGVSGCLAVARLAVARGVVYCPHFLGAGIGLLASAHLLAAQGGGGMLEMDTNPNPLREELTAGFLDLHDGTIVLPDLPGIGITPDHLFV